MRNETWGRRKNGFKVRVRVRVKLYREGGGLGLSCIGRGRVGVKLYREGRVSNLIQSHFAGFSYV